MSGRNGLGPIEAGPQTGRRRGVCSGSVMNRGGNLVSCFTSICGAGYGLFRMLRRKKWQSDLFRGNRIVNRSERIHLERQAQMLMERLRIIEEELTANLQEDKKNSQEK